MYNYCCLNKIFQNVWQFLNEQPDLERRYVCINCLSLTVSRGQLVSLRSRWDRELVLDKNLKRDCKTTHQVKKYLSYHFCNTEYPVYWILVQALSSVVIICGWAILVIKSELHWPTWISPKPSNYSSTSGCMCTVCVFMCVFCVCKIIFLQSPTFDMEHKHRHRAERTVASSVTRLPGLPDRSR